MSCIGIKDAGDGSRIAQSLDHCLHKFLGVRLLGLLGCCQAS